MIRHLHCGYVPPDTWQQVPVIRLWACQHSWLAHVLLAVQAAAASPAPMDTDEERADTAAGDDPTAGDIGMDAVETASAEEQASRARSIRVRRQLNWWLGFSHLRCPGRIRQARVGSCS